MKQIEEIANELSKKHSWIEAGFNNFLDIWSRETGELKYDSVTDMVSFDVYEEDDNPVSYQYCLVAGNDHLQKLDPVDFQYGRKTKDVYISNKDIDMAKLRQIILALPEKLKKYAERLAMVGAECDSINKILAMLNPQES